MNLFDLNTDKIIMNMNGKDIEMKPAICYGKEIDKWLVSRCGKVWSTAQGQNKFLSGQKMYSFTKEGKHLDSIQMSIKTRAGFWEDGSGNSHESYGDWIHRDISVHKIVMDTWAPLYDNPPEGVSWEFWKIGRKYPDNLTFYSESVVIDHIDNDPTNNHCDNLKRTTNMKNNPHRKARGI